ncbi:hypothetical protein B0H11DRAFT_2127353, partial [Mycena galericulata]
MLGRCGGISGVSNLRQKMMPKQPPSCHPLARLRLEEPARRASGPSSASAKRRLRAADGRPPLLRPVYTTTCTSSPCAALRYPRGVRSRRMSSPPRVNGLGVHPTVDDTAPRLGLRWTTRTRARTGMARTRGRGAPEAIHASRRRSRSQRARAADSSTSTRGTPRKSGPRSPA